MRLEFLEFLTFYLGFDYISDLRFRPITPLQAAGLMALPVNAFSLDELKRAARYVGASADFYDAMGAITAVVLTLLRR